MTTALYYSKPAPAYNTIAYAKKQLSGKGWDSIIDVLGPPSDSFHFGGNDQDVSLETIEKAYSGQTTYLNTIIDEEIIKPDTWHFEVFTRRRANGLQDKSITTLSFKPSVTNRHTSLTPVRRITYSSSEKKVSIKGYGVGNEWELRFLQKEGGKAYFDAGKRAIFSSIVLNMRILAHVAITQCEDAFSRLVKQNKNRFPTLINYFKETFNMFGIIHKEKNGVLKYINHAERVMRKSGNYTIDFFVIPEHLKSTVLFGCDNVLSYKENGPLATDALKRGEKHLSVIQDYPFFSEPVQNLKGSEINEIDFMERNFMSGHFYESTNECLNFLKSPDDYDTRQRNIALLDYSDNTDWKILSIYSLIDNCIAFDKNNDHLCLRNDYQYLIDHFNAFLSDINFKFKNDNHGKFLIDPFIVYNSFNELSVVNYVGEHHPHFLTDDFLDISSDIFLNYIKKHLGQDVLDSINILIQSAWYNISLEYSEDDIINSNNNSNKGAPFELYGIATITGFENYLKSNPNPFLNKLLNDFYKLVELLKRLFSFKESNLFLYDEIINEKDMIFHILSGIELNFYYAKGPGDPYGLIIQTLGINNKNVRHLVFDGHFKITRDMIDFLNENKGYDFSEFDLDNILNNTSSEYSLIAMFYENIYSQYKKKINSAFFSSIDNSRYENLKTEPINNEYVRLDFIKNDTEPNVFINYNPLDISGNKKYRKKSSKKSSKKKSSSTTFEEPLKKKKSPSTTFDEPLKKDGDGDGDEGSIGGDEYADTAFDDLDFGDGGAGVTGSYKIYKDIEIRNEKHEFSKLRYSKHFNDRLNDFVGYNTDPFKKLAKYLYLGMKVCGETYKKLAKENLPVPMSFFPTSPWHEHMTNCGYALNKNLGFIEYDYENTQYNFDGEIQKLTVDATYFMNAYITTNNFLVTDSISFNGYVKGADIDFINTFKSLPDNEYDHTYNMSVLDDHDSDLDFNNFENRKGSIIVLYGGPSTTSNDFTFKNMFDISGSFNSEFLNSIFLNNNKKDMEEMSYPCAAFFSYISGIANANTGRVYSNSNYCELQKSDYINTFCFRGRQNEFSVKDKRYCIINHRGFGPYKDMKPNSGDILNGYVGCISELVDNSFEK